MVSVNCLKGIKFERLAWHERAHDSRYFTEDSLGNYVVVQLVNQSNLRLGLLQYHINALVKNSCVSVCSLQINT